MRKKIHPRYKPLLVKIGKDVFETRSSYSGNEILMDIDYRTHPAWTGKATSAFDSSNKDINEFNSRFPGLFAIKK